MQQLHEGSCQGRRLGGSSIHGNDPVCETERNEAGWNRKLVIGDPETFSETAGLHLRIDGQAFIRKEAAEGADQVATVETYLFSRSIRGSEAEYRAGVRMIRYFWQRTSVSSESTSSG